MFLDVLLLYILHIYLIFLLHLGKILDVAITILDRNTIYHVSLITSSGNCTFNFLDDFNSKQQNTECGLGNENG